MTLQATSQSPSFYNTISCEEACLKITEKLQNLSKEEVFTHLVELGKQLPALEESFKDDQYLVKGCISRAWLIPRSHQGHIYFFLDSEALIVKGILCLLRKVYHGRKPEEILAVSPEFWKETGITMILSMNRRNGIAHMLKQIRLYALTASYLPSLSDTNSPKNQEIL